MVAHMHLQLAINSFNCFLMRTACRIMNNVSWIPSLWKEIFFFGGKIHLKVAWKNSEQVTRPEQLSHLVSSLSLGCLAYLKLCFT